jgi:hypothetical protein
MIKRIIFTIAALILFVQGNPARADDDFACDPVNGKLILRTCQEERDKAWRREEPHPDCDEISMEQAKNAGVICVLGYDGSTNYTIKKIDDIQNQLDCTKLKDGFPLFESSYQIKSSWVTCEEQPEDSELVNVNKNKEDFCSEVDDVAAYRAAFAKIFWFRAPFKTILNTMKPVSESVYNVLKIPLQKLMAVLFALWMCWQILQFITGNLAGGGPSGTETYQKLIAGVFRLAVANLLLMAGMDAILDLTVNYVIGVGLYIANAIIQCNASGAAEACDGGEAAKTLDSSQSGFLFLKANFMALLQAINAKLMSLVADGVVLIRHSLKTGTLCIIPNLSPFLSGMVFLGFGLALLVRVPLRFIDPIFSLLIITVMLPILIVCWVFPYSRQFTKKGFELLVGSLGMFITIAVMIAIIAGVLGALQADVTVTDSTQLAKDMSFGESAETIFGWLGALWFCYVGFGAVNDLAETLFNAPPPSIAGDAIKAADALPGKAASFAKKARRAWRTLRHTA